jgi:hypothetical protein
MLAAGGKNDQRFRLRCHWFDRPFEQDAAQSFSDQCSSRFSGMQDVVAPPRQQLDQANGLRGFPAAFASFECNEDA